MVAACTPVHAWKQLNTSDLACKPFEIEVVRGRYHDVSRIRGLVDVTDGEHATRIDGVQVVLRRLGAREPLAAVTTDAAGSFALGDWPDDWYQLETCRSGFDSVVVSVRVRKNAKDALITLSLRVAN